jgi:hypothetical protein
VGEEAFSVPGCMVLLSLLLALWEKAPEEKCVKRPLALSDCSKVVLVSLRPVLKMEVWERTQDVIGTPLLW